MKNKKNKRFAAKKVAEVVQAPKQSKAGSDDFSSELIKQLNKEAGSQIAFNLSVDDAPTNVKRWISTGSRQLDAILSNRLDGGFPEGRIVEIQGPTSCHSPGTKLLMYDGTLKKIEDIKIGDQLMGPDSTPRNVWRTVNGTDDMYKITQKRTKFSYTVNQHHELVLEHRFSGKRTIIPVNEYVKKNNWFKTSNRWIHTDVKKFGGEIKNDFIIPPYILGLLLGDGCLQRNRVELTTMDDEILNEYKSFVNLFNYKLTKHPKNGNRASGYYHTTGQNSNQFLKSNDKIRNEIIRLGLSESKSGDKFIPKEYKTSSYKNRLELLAGLIDTDGHNNKNLNVDFISKSNQLAEDVAFISRSVGLVVCKTIKTINNAQYYRLCITGELSKIPSRLPRKTVPSYKKRSNPLTFGIDVEFLGPGKYYGITVDKDNLYLGKDFSIIKNCGKSHIALAVAKNTQKLGGIVVYIDTENATNLDNLIALGVDVKSRFIFVQTTCTEEIFTVAENTILKARAMQKDVPVTIIWDSVAASSPKAELEGDYDQSTIGLQARVLGKGMRKITNIIGNQKVLFLLINQQRSAIGCIEPNTPIEYKKLD